MTKTKVADADDMKPGDLRAVEAAGVRICLASLDDGSIAAISDTCTHEGASLSDGEIYRGSVQCPLHSSLFDLKTGQVVGMPAMIPIQTYPVTIEAGAVFVEID